MTPGDATTASPVPAAVISPSPSTWTLPRSSPVPGSTTATVSAPSRAAIEVPSSNTASRPIAPSSVATWAASRIGVSTPPAPVRSSSAIVVSSTHSSPDSVPMYSWSESGSNATALAPGSSSVPMGLRVWRSRPSTPSPVATHTRSPARVDTVALAAGLDRRVPDRRRDLAARRHVPAGEQRDPAGHHVLREVRMRPLVDRVVDPVAPRLQELGRGAGVVDLVEVHPGGLGEPEHPEAHARDDEHDEDPQVQAVQPAAALAVQQA